MSELDHLLFGSLGERQSLSPREVARALGVSVRTVYVWASEEKIVSTALGNGTLRIVRSSVVQMYHAGIEARKDRLGSGAEGTVPELRPQGGVDSGLSRDPSPRKTNAKPPKKSGSGWIRRY